MSMVEAIEYLEPTTWSEGHPVLHCGRNGWSAGPTVIPSPGTVICISGHFYKVLRWRLNGHVLEIYIESLPDVDLIRGE